MNKTHSLKKRYVAKLSTNLIGLVFALVITAIVPRGLGPKAYGDFNFLTVFFTQLIPFFTLSTSIGFYTKLSQRQDEFGLISFYSILTGFAFISLFTFIIIIQLIGLTEVLWVDQNISYIYMAALYAAVMWLITSLTKIADAYGITVSTEIARIVQKFIGMILIVALFLLKQLNLTNFFLYHYFISILLIIAFIWLINRFGFSFNQSWKLSKEKIKEYSREFYHYSQPLFIYSIIGVFVGIFDRWLLQKIGGSVQQGFFGLAFQLGAICFLFTSAMAPLITREFSIAYKKNDLIEMRRLFRRYIPLLYGIAAVIGCFMSVQADKLVYIFGGSQFADASTVIMIMAFYPIHQTYGQLSGSVFYASGQTKLYRNIGVIVMILGLPVVYVALAPTEHFGFNAGAVGLAVKFVMIQFIAVNVQLYFNAKYLNLSFIKYFTHQIISVSILIFLAITAKHLTNFIIISSDENIFIFIISGIIYAIFVIILFFTIPVVFGLQKKDINNGLHLAKNYIRKII